MESHAHHENPLSYWSLCTFKTEGELHDHKAGNHGKDQAEKHSPEWMAPAGAKVPTRLTVRQKQYSNQTIRINQFCYNLALTSHRFHRVNRLR